MFSGIVKGIGRILDVTDPGADRRLAIGFDPDEIAWPGIGASIAVNGTCLTVTHSGPDRFEADVSAETLAATTLAQFEAGRRVNLEPSLRLGDPMDGHWVAGHVDGVGHIAALRDAGRSLILEIDLPPELGRYVARKGSVAVDGVSLTVNAVDAARFEVNVVPHTRDVTIIADYSTGAPVNLEVDVVARYLERLVSASDGLPGR